MWDELVVVVVVALTLVLVGVRLARALGGARSKSPPPGCSSCGCEGGCAPAQQKGTRLVQLRRHEGS